MEDSRAIEVENDLQAPLPKSGLSSRQPEMIPGIQTEGRWPWTTDTNFGGVQVLGHMERVCSGQGSFESRAIEPDADRIITMLRGFGFPIEKNDYAGAAKILRDRYPKLAKFMDKYDYR